MNTFNAFQFTAAFAAMPFLVQWLFQQNGALCILVAPVCILYVGMFVLTANFVYHGSKK
jgi:hypothetical protein